MNLSELHDCGVYRAGVAIDRYDAPQIRAIAREIGGVEGPAPLEAAMALLDPVERYESAKNLLLNNGINAGLLARLVGVTTTAYDNANARIGVGNSATAPTAAQTGLLGGASTAYKGMNSGFPPAPSNQQVQFQASFTELEALFVWNEWGILNGAAGGGSTVQLNRALFSPVPNGGAAKPNTQIWVVTATLGFS
jgi:hypothetical protein